MPSAPSRSRSFVASLCAAATRRGQILGVCLMEIGAVAAGDDQSMPRGSRLGMHERYGLPVLFNDRRRGPS